MTIRRRSESRIKLGILRVLSESDSPVGSTTITKELMKTGLLLSERTVRHYLKTLEHQGLVSGHGKTGRSLTRSGLQELSNSLTYQRLDFVLTRYLSLAYSITYRPKSNRGSVIANVTLLDKQHLNMAMETVHRLNEVGLLVAPYVKLVDEDESYAEISVGRGNIALLTVCNLTLDGILIRSGIPLVLRYGGIVQFIDSSPIRFVELMSYEGTTVPPLEVFVYRKMTSITNYLKTGSGMIPANFREIPNEALEKVRTVLSDLSQVGWRGVTILGRPSEPLLGVPVGIGRCGISIVGGVTPTAALKEIGLEVETFAPHCIVDIEEMKRIE